ncbi:MAG: hypothetical protein WC273_10985 [Dehalococcoidia bacterium]
MIPGRFFLALTSVFVGWLMVRLSVGAALVGVHLVLDGNAWAVLMAVPAAAGIALAISAVSSGAQVLLGPR